MNLEIALTGPQDDFVHATEPYPAMVAGYGAGKSFAGIWRAIKCKLQYPGQSVAYYLPTYDLVTRMLYPRFEEELTKLQLPYKINKNDNVIDLGKLGMIIARTMDNPARIVAYEVADSILDEIDTLATDKAYEVWQKALARNRQKKPDKSRNTMAVATTPEGFKFVYEKWKQDPGAEAKGYRIIKASTYSNAHNLPANYIDDLKADYPSNRIAAYLEGEFVNLTSGSIYAEFDRIANASTVTIQPSEPLHIGQDFNVGNMCSVVFVLRDGLPHAVDELTGILDTPALIATIKQRYQGHAIHVYPDATGNSRKSNNASESDIALLRAARFNVLVAPSNPAVKDRILSMNQLIHSDGQRRLKVNVDKCPSFVEALEKQAYDKNGEPDKTSGFDHLNDAAGYFAFYRYPVRTRAMQRLKIGGF